MGAHQPDEIHPLFQDAFNLRDVEALVSLYEPHAILIVGGKQITGRENLKAAFHSMLTAGVRMRLTTRSIIESADGLAILHGERAVQRATSEDQVTTYGISTEVIRKQPDGTWLFITDEPYTPVLDSSNRFLAHGDFQLPSRDAGAASRRTSVRFPRFTTAD